MEKGLRCECGFEVHPGDEAELVAQVQGHALTVHGMRFTPEEVLQLAARAESKTSEREREEERR